MVSVEDGPRVGGVGKEVEEWITSFLSFLFYLESASGTRVSEEIVLSHHLW